MSHVDNSCKCMTVKAGRVYAASLGCSSYSRQYNINAQVTARLVKSVMAGILCVLLILVTPQKIMYDGSSGVVIMNLSIMDTEDNIPLQTHGAPAN